MIKIAVESYRLHRHCVHTYALLHPHHIIPSVELVAALGKASDHVKPKVSMKLDAVVSDVWVFISCTGDAGIHVEYSHLLQFCLQRVVQQPANTFACFSHLDIDGCLYRPVVGGT